MVSSRFSIFWSVGALCLAGPTAFAQPGPTESPLPPVHLADLLERAGSANLDLRLARLQSDAASLVPRQVSKLPDPMVGVVAMPLGDLAEGKLAQLRVEQALPYPGKLRLVESIAALGASMAGTEVDAGALVVEFDVKQAYFELVREQETRRLIEEFRTELLRFEEIAATRYAVGSGNQQAILMAQVERSRLSLQLDQLSRQRRSALEQLARLLDLSDTTRVAGPVAWPELVGGLDAEGLLEEAVAVRPELKALALAGERAERQAELARIEGRPDFMVSAMYGMAEPGMSASGGGRRALGVGIGVRVPVWRDRVRASIEQAEVERQSVGVRTEQFELDLRTTLDDLAHQFTVANRQLDLLRSLIIPQAESTRESTLFAYTTGASGFLDLLDVERTLFMLRTEEIDLQLQLHQAQARIEQVIGRTTVRPSDPN